MVKQATMLKTLQRIVEEVNNARGFREAMEIMVQRVREAMNTDSCSVYLRDRKQGGYVLLAAEGFREEAVGKVRVAPGEGLTGLVAQREEPINLADAAKHEHYRYFPETGEERYHAFLGVPIIHQRKVLGVLVVQQHEPRRYDEAEEAFLVTLSAQLAGGVAHAQATGSIPGVTSPDDIQAERWVGTPASLGVGIGTAVVSYPLADLESVPDRAVDDIDAEIEAYRTAIKAARSDIVTLRGRLETTLPREEQALFNVYIQILDSRSLAKEVIKEIRQNNWAPGALRRVIKRHEQHIQSVEDEYIRERAIDVRDLGRRILAHLRAQSRTVPDYPDNTILVGEEITAATLAEVPVKRLAGLISLKGSSNSHTAIIARALGVPAIMGAESRSLPNIDGKEVIVDGYHGHIFVEPAAYLRQEYQRLAEEERELSDALKKLRDLPAETPDGQRVSLCVNTGLVADITPALEVGAEGVGLYRTEVPFMLHDRFPGEDEQRAIYRQVLEAFAPHPVTIRTLDIGGDKALPYFPIEEDNPFLGWRGIRVTLDHPEIFLIQLRAIIRASVDLNNLHIMLPMISNLYEVDEALRLVHQAYTEVADKHPGLAKPKVGVMIEVPAAVYLAGALAERVDFLSVGSNDLTQYLLAVDRNNARVSNLYDALHPAVIEALEKIVEAAHAKGKPVSICGELAGDPAAAILLLAMGFDTLSMNATGLPRIKWVIRNFTRKKAKALLADVKKMDNTAQVREYLDKAIEEAGLGGLIRAGKS